MIALYSTLTVIVIKHLHQQAFACVTLMIASVFFRYASVKTRIASQVISQTMERVSHNLKLEFQEQDVKNPLRPYNYNVDRGAEYVI